MAQPMRVLQHQQLPPEAEQLAAMYQLGTPQVEYRTRARVGVIIAWGILGGILGCIFLLAGVGSASDVATMITFFIIGLLILGVVLYCALLPLTYRSWRAYTCTEGFVIVRGSRVDAFRWDQIGAMWYAVTRYSSYGVYRRTIHKYTIRRKDGVKVMLDDRFADVETLGNTISRELTRCLLPQVINAYNAGSTITFGPFSVSLQGVSNGRELLPWNQIKVLRLNRGFVMVRKEGKWLTWSAVRVADVPNIFVFMALVDYVLKGQK